MADLLQGSAGVDPLVDGVAEVHANDLEHVGGIHGWFHVWEFPRGCWTPICACGFFEADRWFSSREAAMESECPRRVAHA